MIASIAVVINEDALAGVIRISRIKVFSSLHHFGHTLLRRSSTRFFTFSGIGRDREKDGSQLLGFGKRDALTKHHVLAIRSHLKPNEHLPREVFKGNLEVAVSYKSLSLTAIPFLHTAGFSVCPDGVGWSSVLLSSASSLELRWA